MQESEGEALTAITLFRVQGRGRWWALKQMRFGPIDLASQEGLRFGKVMGSGDGVGFSAKPNLGVWAVLSVWNTPEAFLTWQRGPWLSEYKAKAEEQVTICQYAVRARGLWNGEQPFPLEEAPAFPTLRGVITRGTIRPSRLLKFWSTVPSTSRATERAAGRLFSIGIGEVPWLEQATWSLWESEDAIRAFAYGSAAHKAAIKKTHTLNWYREELFARFVPFATIGSWSTFPDLSSHGVTHFSDVPLPSALREARARQGEAGAR
ncbi:MAG: hypothetical protein ACOC45_04780 [Alkalispirochaetaceae bacterium]